MYLHMHSVCVRVRAFMRACVRACVHAYVRACVHVFVRMMCVCITFVLDFILCGYYLVGSH